MMPRMHQPLGQRPVIREQNQPFGKIIQPANGVQAAPHAQRFRYQIQNSLPPLRVPRCRQNPHGLVKHQAAWLALFGRNENSVDLNPVFCLINLRPYFRRKPVNQHRA